jgi:hypothetical protein
MVCTLLPYIYIQVPSGDCHLILLGVLDRLLIYSHKCLDLLPDGWAFPTFTTEQTGSFWSSILESYTSTASNTDFQVYEVPEQASVPTHRLLDFFDFATESPDAESFMKSFNALVEFVEGNEGDKRRFGAFSLSSLPAFAEQYGQESDAFTAIILAVRATLSNVSYTIEYFCQGLQLMLV